MEQIKEGRFLDDKESLQALVSLMSESEAREYQGYGALALVSGFPNRKLVVYTLSAYGPEDVTLLTLGTMEMQPATGPEITITDALGTERVGVNPRRWRDKDLFLHVPQNFIFKWKGKPTQAGIQFAPHYAILVKMRSKPFHRVDGHTYCVTLNDFREQYPKVPLRY